jgi:benzoate-CoA ligase
MNLFQAIFNQDSLGSVAILFEQRQITYEELRAETRAVAAALRALEIEPGERVALLLNDSPEFIASFVAICSYGAIAVPINLALRLDEQRAIFRDCTASVAIVEADVYKTLLREATNNLPQLRQVVVVDRGFPTKDPSEHGEKTASDSIEILSFAKLISDAQVPNEKTSAITSGEVDDTQPAFILYTSGSTGEPKGAVHRQSDIFYTNETYCHEVLQLRPSDRLFSSSRLPFAYGLGNALTFPLLNGCTTILCREKPSPEVIAKVFATQQPTIFFAVPVVYRMLLDVARKQEAGNLSPSPFGKGPGRGHSSNSAPSPNPSQRVGKKNPPLDCSSLRLCISAGEALPPQLGEEWEATFGVPIIDGIGSTEMLHMWMSNHEREVVYGSSGKLLKGYEAQLLDPEGQPTLAGAEGNLWVRGASAAVGYWNRRATTARTFVDGWVRTGDLYRQDADGFWFHMGRSDDCFKSSGQWVSPVEVEGVLLRHESINRVAVVEDFDDDGLPCACAFVVRADASLDEPALEQGLRELARAALPRFKQPRRYVFVEELPYTATGKIQRFKLRQRLKTVQMPMSNA